MRLGFEGHPQVCRRNKCASDVKGGPKAWFWAVNDGMTLHERVDRVGGDPERPPAMPRFQHQLFGGDIGSFASEAFRDRLKIRVADVTQDSELKLAPALPEGGDQIHAQFIQRCFGPWPFTRARAQRVLNIAPQLVQQLNLNRPFPGAHLFPLLRHPIGVQFRSTSIWRLFDAARFW